MHTSDDPCHAVTDFVALFEQVYQQRMLDMPMVNPALTIEAVGFRPWQNRCVGILITPWFMNLMILLPPTEQRAQPPAADEKVLHQFPSGSYEFLRCHETGFGDYLSCSLFSPMFDFTNQALAQQTALAVVDLLWQPPAQYAAPATATDAQAPNKLSRRELLRGKIGRSSKTEE
jgi:[NiFe] hydrogenase assembly HybE family chaperone